MIPAAFFAPMKSPHHANPSGDREIARNLMQALKRAGFAPTLASELRCLEIKGDAPAQRALIAEAHAQIPALVAQGRRENWRIWVTYHNYYKAPDLLGPQVAHALGIPYVQIESTRARKRLGGPWDLFAQHAEAAADAADIIFYVTQRDAQALTEYRFGTQQLIHLPPFLPLETMPSPSDRSGPMLTVAMMRPGDKLDSYALIAETLSHMGGDWQLDIAGDGAARAEVEALLAPFSPRVRFLGALGRDALNQVYKTASLLLWPGVNEAIGMVYLEAQAHGIPVVAQARPGLIDALVPGPYPAPEAGAKALAEAIMAPQPSSDTLQRHMQKTHLLPAAANRLSAALLPLVTS